jgi:hypothetical protein
MIDRHSTGSSAAAVFPGHIDGSASIIAMSNRVRGYKGQPPMRWRSARKTKNVMDIQRHRGNVDTAQTWLP